jgi:hypothetical protein
VTRPELAGDDRSPQPLEGMLGGGARSREPRGRSDELPGRCRRADTRAWGPPYDERGEATYFQAVNRTKRTIALDLRDAGDVARGRVLARE